MHTILFSGLAVLAGAVFAWLAERSRSQPKLAVLEKSNRTLFEQWTEARDGLERVRDDLEQAREQLGIRDRTIARLEERANAAQAALEQMRSTLPDTFKFLAAEELEKKSKAFAQQNQASLDQLLAPLKQRLDGFQKKVEEVHDQQVRGEATLQQQVGAMIDANARIGQEANHLANALTGSSKAQGNWGELVLERILESAGLREGIEYEAQESYAAENGRRFQPDVVIHLPGERHVVVDSKVSLVDYQAYCNAENDISRSAALRCHLNSVHAHIKGLAGKKYQTLYGLNSLDFVIMFLPIEPAFMLALSQDDKLWEQAWQSNVLLTSPSTLLFVVRTVAYLWRQEQQKRNAQEIARQGAELYDKFTRFVDDLTGVGKQLDGAQKSYQDALAKLSSERGNLIRRAERLRELGVKPSKQLPQSLVEVAQQENLDLEDPVLEDPVSE